MKTTIYNGDCLVEMKKIPDGSVDMVLCDLPYGMTGCVWDAVIPFDKLWAEYERVCKPDANIVLFALAPFTYALGMSKIQWFRYAWVWEKENVTGFLNAKKHPLRITEDILVFYKDRGLYKPQGLKPCMNTKLRGGGGSCYPGVLEGGHYKQENTNYPRNILKFGRDGDRAHPTQKPVALLKYLIKTYTEEGQLVLDNTMGSGSTGVACVKTGRSFIGIEMDPKYFEISTSRIESAKKRLW